MTRRVTKRTDNVARRVKQTRLPGRLRVEGMSAMGKELFELSREYERSGGKLLAEHEIELEIALRRGGFQQNNGR